MFKINHVCTTIAVTSIVIRKQEAFFINAAVGAASLQQIKQVSKERIWT